MSNIVWSERQLAAINARGGAVLVSAAAGSGKTAVLVERVLRRLEDTQNPCDPSQLLIVTFTRAAAAQLRQKLSVRLAERARRHPELPQLRRKLLLLPSAQISTIDSLCGRLVKENFNACSLPPDFKLLDDAQSRAMEGDAMDELLQEAYAQENEGFAALSALFGDARGDDKLEGVILSIYRQAQANPNPREWLHSLLAPYEENCPLRDSVWGKAIVREADEAIESLLALHNEALPVLEQEEEVAASFGAAYASDIAILSGLRHELAQGAWDDICARLEGTKLVSRGRAPKGYEQTELFLWAEKRRDRVKKTIKKLKAELFFLNEKTVREDTALLLPQARELIRLAEGFEEKLKRRKIERGCADFGDVQHLALGLLIDEKGQKTPLAKALSEQFAEILVDEYQDVNRLQEALFRALSRDESNLFFVGDVKQSIYRFRQAEPGIFLERRDSLAPYDPEEKRGGRVFLAQNYRSLPGVTGFVNTVFSALMQKRAGELDYTEEEYLVPFRRAEGEKPDVIFRLLRTGEGDRDEQQARYCASLVEKLLSQGRRAEDIAILMRSPRKKAALYKAALERRGIACQTELSGGFFETNEIRLALSLLQVIDNPLQDVPLLAVLLSPLFGFCEDDAAEISLLEGDGLYSKILLAANQDSRYDELLKFLAKWRKLSLAMPCALFVRRLFEESGLFSIVQAMKNGAGRKANLQRLAELAEQSLDAESPGLSGLLRFLDAIKERGLSLDAANTQGGGVRLMSIHKSKGLEFPVCIIADIGRGFNTAGAKSAAICAPKGGLGLKLRQGDAFGVYPTIQHTAAKLETAELDRAEELRLLYVAATRAKEQLCLIGATDRAGSTAESLMEKAAAAMPLSGGFFPAHSVRGQGSYLGWLLAALGLPHVPGYVKPPLENQAFRLDFRIDDIPPEEGAVEPELDFPPPDEAMLAEIRKCLNWQYPSTVPAGIAAKQTASSFAKGDYPENIAQRAPAFLQAEQKSAASRGTLLHWVLERLDFPAAFRDFEAALGEIAGEGGLDVKQLTGAEKQMLRDFAQSEIVGRMAASGRLERERQFTARLAVEELYPEHSGCREKITVIGAADCVFEEDGGLVVVDYKTDRASAEQLLGRYAPQLRVYALALSKCKEMPVKAVLLYSLRNREEVEVRL
ncbi:MAG: UvrD-helicase domain-containing protein [Clostridium sp.]|jgi:ATP-dependent helicase/nuclease subunit A|nr:UvrD-helicase domain-containing protein [Clostridium sp.]